MTSAVQAIAPEQTLDEATAIACNDDSRRKDRDIAIDALRGTAITLVVLGHAVQASAGEGFQRNIVFQAIHSFHMPLFFFISGYLFKEADGLSSWLVKLKRKSIALLLPYLSWTLLWHACYVLSRGRVGMMMAWNSIWFLPVLLACFWIHAGVSMGVGCCWLHVSRGLLGGLTICAMYTVGSTGFWLGSIRYHYIFFLAGALLCRRYVLWNVLHGWVALFCGVLWGFLLLRSFRWLSFHESVSQAIAMKVFFVGFRVALAFLAIYPVSFIVRSAPRQVKQVVSVLGIYSIHIYLVHIGFSHFLCDHCTLLGPWFWLSVGVMLLIPLVVAKATEGHGFTSMILFGRKTV